MGKYFVQDISSARDITVLINLLKLGGTEGMLPQENSLIFNL